MDDVDADAEDAARVDRTDDRIDQLLPGRPGACVHCLLHHVRAAVVDALELGGVERGLVVVVGPDVVHLAAARYDQLVDVGCRAADMGVGGAEIAFLVSAETADATAFATDVAGCKTYVHQCPDDAVVVIPPNDAFLISGDSLGTAAVLLGFGDPFGGLDDLRFGQAGGRCPVRKAHLAGCAGGLE